MVSYKDFKYWRYRCLVAKGKFQGKTVVPLACEMHTKEVGIVRATDEEFAKKEAKRKITKNYSEVIHIVDLVVEEIKQ